MCLIQENSTILLLPGNKMEIKLRKETQSDYFDIWNIKAPFNVPDNVFMAIELVENGLLDISGVVKYPKEFEEVVCEY